MRVTPGARHSTTPHFFLFNVRCFSAKTTTCSSTVTSLQVPLSNCQSRRTAFISTSRPATDQEVAQAFASVSKGYPRGFETSGQVARSVAQLALHGLPDSYFEEFVPKLSQVTAADVTAAAQRYLDPEKMTTVIVGDLDKIAASLPELGFGPHRVLTIEP